jgi:hypothetical protein
MKTRLEGLIRNLPRSMHDPHIPGGHEYDSPRKYDENTETRYRKRDRC